MAFDLLVIGGGPAGVVAALRARELGASVALVERGELGGTCTNDGCVPTRVLAKAARLLREAEHFDEYGLVGSPPRVDLGQLLGRTREIIAAIHDKKQLLAHLQRAGVLTFSQAGNARFITPHAIELASGQRLEAERFIICAGGRARRLTFPGSDYALTHQDLWLLPSLPNSMAIVGGSATGCQLGSIFDAFGVEVTILERGGQILDREDDLLSQAMGDAFRRRGIHLIEGIDGVERIDKTATGLDLYYSQQGQVCTLAVEAVVIAAGWPGNADLLNLAAAGVKAERGYVVVDDYLQTSVPHIFAAGDINGRMMLVQSASHEARIAAENAVLGLGQPLAHQVVPHGGFTDPEYASVGLTEAAARAAEPDALVATVPYTHLDRAIIDERTEGFCKLVVSRETHRILGAHIVGEQALEAIQLVAAAMAADMWVEQLAEMELAYPTYTAIVGLAARQVVRDLGVMPLAAEWRALGQADGAEWERSALAIPANHPHNPQPGG